MTLRPVACLALTLLAGCNPYSYFRLTGYLQEGFSNKADILFVIDNSPSMVDEADALAVNFDSFIETFTAEQPPTSTPSLTDDAERYLRYVNDRTGNVNYQLGITTTDGFDDAGRLQGKPKVLGKTDNNVRQKFDNNLLCNAACVTSTPTVDVTCTTGSPGPQNCADSVQGSAEEGIEAVYMAMCRAVEDPPEACFQPWYWNADEGSYEARPPGDTGDTDAGTVEPQDYFSEGDPADNAGFLREGSVVIPVVITDEGDQSRRIGGRSGDTFPYPALFSEFGHRMSWAVIGANAEVCNTAGAAEWGINRYRKMVNDSNGVYIDIAEPDGQNCKTADFGEALTRIGNLLRGLADTFPLRTTPADGSIVVQVNGKMVAEARCEYDESLASNVCDDGWVYDAASNTVVLKGDAVPEFNADVRVWYLPASGVPRTLPF
jgi:hypothetical protein